MSYELTCSCGRALRWQRQTRSQIVTCPGCSRKRLVLPNSPWPQRGAAAGSARTAPSPVSSTRLWRLALLILVAGLAAMGLLFLLVKSHLRRPSTVPGGSPAALIQEHIEAGQRDLRAGNVHLALKELDAAAEQLERHPDLLGRDEYRRLTQMRRESDLLANLLDASLEEVLRQATQHRDDAEWEAKFTDHRGRWVIFDDVLRRDATGGPTLASYTVWAGEIQAKAALGDLTLLRQLPLDLGRRWLFGVRLASCRREEGGVWVIRFDPDSTVLLTDEEAALACYLSGVDDELRAVLQRQSEWLRR